MPRPNTLESTVLFYSDTRIEDSELARALIDLCIILEFLVIKIDGCPIVEFDVICSGSNEGRCSGYVSGSKMDSC